MKSSDRCQRLCLRRRDFRFRASDFKVRVSLWVLSLSLSTLFVLAGCLEVDQGTLVVKPKKSKQSTSDSEPTAATRKVTRSEATSRRSKNTDDPALAKELAQVDELLRMVGGVEDDLLEGFSGGEKTSIIQAGFSDEPETKKKSSTGTRTSSPTEANVGSHKGKANRLAKESSPYLLLHAHNPVDWFPWGPEAFERAKKENKLIFLSIGYSSCHWCHVMERLVFSNEAIAKFMNEHFINVKVDREERPDIDDIYMTAITVYFRLSGSQQGGGWPLSMFLTANGKPIAGGTYFPPDDQEGRMGFPTVMKKIADLWRDEAETLEKNADVITAHVQRTMSAKVALKDVPLTAELAANAAKEIAETYDAKFGGFDFQSSRPTAPKFPVPSKLALLLYSANRDRDDATRAKVTFTLDAMAAGGIRDHLAGGFHRYSTDRAWLVPHFEKMLYDNAQLADIYVEAFRQTNNAEYKRIAEETCDFVLREMSDKRGGFFSALDADSEEVEGKSYVWSEREIDQLLDADTAESFKLAYGLREKNTFEVGFVLHQPQPLDEVAKLLKMPLPDLERQLATAKTKLLAARNRRPAPLLDDKILTAWNGLMIKGLANAAARLNRADYLAAAERAATFVLTELRDKEGRLLRTHRGGVSKIKAYLDDYAFFVDSLIALHLATRDPKWLNVASRLTDDQLQLFWDDTGHGFFYTATDHEELLARAKDRYDSVIPSGNSVAVRNLIRLAKLTGKETYRTKAEQTLKAFAPSMNESPYGFANLSLGLFEFLDQPDFGASRRIVDPNINLASDEVIDLTARPKRDTATGNSSVPPADKEASKSDKSKKNEILTAEAHLNVDRLPAGSTCRIALVVNVNSGWHINQNPAQPDYMLPTRFTMSTKQGTKLIDVKYPKGHKFNLAGFDDPLFVYEGQVVLFATLEVPEKASGKIEEFELQLRYQACNDDKCEQPKTLKLAGKVEIAPTGEKVQTINDKLFNPLPTKPPPKKE